MIVGAGIAGITLARRYAEEKNCRVLIVEKKLHIGGQCYDYRNKEGILVHKYGPHIFRTSSKLVYDYLSKFTEWYDYQHKVLASVNGQLLPMPINLDTINQHLGTSYTSDNVLEYFEKVKTYPQEINNIKNAVESQVGPIFYEDFFKNYTTKQWGEDPSKLPASIISRIPIRSNRDNRYFTAKYQGIPKEGYSKMFENMLDNPNIQVLLNTSYNQIKDVILADKIFYSGSIDEYFDYCFGKLPYRCVYFNFEEYDCQYYQPVAVVNYPNNYDYTRITEFKHFTNHKSRHTIIAKEYSSNIGAPSYPIPTGDNIDLYQKYNNLVKNNIRFIGRLGHYKYFSMDQTVEEILNEKDL